MSVEFLLICLAVVASPGIGVVITVAAGLSGGTRAAIVAAFGCTLGIVPHMLAAITGLAAVLHASALAYDVIRYAGVVYLLWMAWLTLRERSALSVTAAPAARSDLRVIGAAVVANLLNPKLSIFFFAFLPQFVPPETASPVGLMLELSTVFMAMTFVVFALYGVFAAAMRRRILSRPAVLAWLRRGFAAAFAGLGIKLAIAER